MIKETVSLKVDYEKAGLDPEGCEPVLDCYANTVTEEIGRKNRRAVLVLPGGGYDFLSEREADPIAFRFLGAGFAAFVLRYSVYRKKWPTDLLECAAAVKYIRENAEKYDLDPDKVVVCGFSAGGHLAASVSNFWNTELVTDALSCKAEDEKVNGTILGYPVITSDPAFTHEGSIQNLIGEEKSEELRELVSMEKRVSENTPQTFIWHCADDGLVSVMNSLRYMSALSENKIPFEAHIYEWGGHGLANADETTSTNEWHIQPVAAKWMQSAIDWVKRL